MSQTDLILALTPDQEQSLAVCRDKWMSIFCSSLRACLRLKCFGGGLPSTPDSGLPLAITTLDDGCHATTPVPTVCSVALSQIWRNGAMQ